MKRAKALAAVIALASSPAAAQDVWGWSVIIPSVTGTDQLGQHLREATRPAPSARPAAPAGPATAAALRFVPSAERRAANFARFVAQRRGGDPQAVRQLETMLARPDLMPEIDRELRKRGLRADDLADAYTIWWIQAWQTAHGQTDEPSPAAIRAVRGQVERAFLASPGLLGLGDAPKQEFAEGLLVQAVIMSAILDQVKQDPAQLRAVGRVARGGARQMGLDLDAIVLTDRGFTPAG